MAHGVASMKGCDCSSNCEPSSARSSPARPRRRGVPRCEQTGTRAEAFLARLARYRLRWVVLPTAIQIAVRPASSMGEGSGTPLMRSEICTFPLALKTDFQKNGRLHKDFGGLDRSKVLHFRVGAPLEVTGNGRAANAQVANFIGESIASWT